MPAPRRHEDAAARQRAYRQRRKLAKPAPRGDLPRPTCLPAMPSAARWKELRERAQADLQTLLDEMEAYRDQRSEIWQDGEKGQAFQQVLDQVEAALEAVQDIE
jgi:hypothetical protein